MLTAHMRRKSSVGRVGTTTVCAGWMLSSTMPRSLQILLVVGRNININKYYKVAIHILFFFMTDVNFSQESNI